MEKVDILLVEDNTLDAKLAIRALNKHNLGQNLLHVIDGAQALNFIFGKGEYSSRDMSNHPKLILMDIKMPKVSGLEVLKIIKQNEHTKNIPVVMITSSREEKDIIQSHDLDVNSYVVKPVSFENFSKAISDVGYYWLVLNHTPAT